MVCIDNLLHYNKHDRCCIVIAHKLTTGNSYYDSYTGQFNNARPGEVHPAAALNNALPVITSNGGGATAAVNAAENQTAVTTVTATDGNAGDTLTYSLSGGADSAKFSINSSTGVLTFVAAPDFETPTDAGGNNVYDVQVTVNDGNGGTDAQDIAVTVTDVVESAPGIDYKLTYNSTTNRYEVWMRPTHTPSGINQTLMAQVTIKVPHVAGTGAFTPTNRSPYTDTLWTVDSVVRAPAEASGADYLSFGVGFPTNNLGAFGWQAGVERRVFSFTNGGVCSGAVTLMANNDPFNTLPNSLGTNPGNAIDVIALGSNPGNDYLSDYSSGAAICPATSTLTVPVKLFLKGAYDSTSGLLLGEVAPCFAVKFHLPYRYLPFLCN